MVLVKLSPKLLSFVRNSISKLFQLFDHLLLLQVLPHGHVTPVFAPNDLQLLSVLGATLSFGIRVADVVALFVVLDVDDQASALIQLKFFPAIRRPDCWLTVNPSKDGSKKSVVVLPTSEKNSHL